MTLRLAFSVAFLIQAQSSPGQGPGLSPQDVFAEFRSAVGQGSGEKAAQLLSKETAALYERLRRAAITTARADLERLSIVEVFGVLSLRHTFSKKELEANTGKSLLAKALVSDPASREALGRIEIDQITYKQDVAIATMKHNGKPVPDTVLTFRKQGNSWKWDLEQYSQQAVGRFETMRLEQKLSKIDFAMRLLRRQYGDKLSNSIIEGPR
jgi:hypothetical protein